MAQQYRYAKKRKRNRIIDFLTALTFIFLLFSIGSFLAAFFISAQQLNEESTRYTMTDGLSGGPPSSSGENSRQDEASSDPAPEPESTPEPEPGITIANVFNGPIPQTQVSSLSYLDDAVFLGDSITNGMTYHNMSEAYIAAATSMSTVGIFGKELEQYDGMTLFEACNAQKPKKIYVMLGSNEIGGISLDSFIDRYEDVLDKLRLANPDALIYLQSVMPVTKSYDEKNNLLNNDLIQQANLLLEQLAARKKVFFIDTHSALADENGYLPEEASPTDGVHFGTSYFDMWIEYVLTHTVPDDVAQQAVKEAQQLYDELANAAE